MIALENKAVKNKSVFVEILIIPSKEALILEKAYKNSL